MAIKPFKRVENYFSGFQKIKADSIDLQFNIISDYLNKQILPTLQTLSNDKIPGSTNPADANKFLQNLGDYSTKWASVSNDSFGVNSLSLEKLVKTNAGGVIATGSDQTFKGIAAIENNQVLASKNNDHPAWKKLSSDNLEDRAITGDNVADATITNENLPPNLISTLIANNTITGNKFKDNSITSIQIADKALTADKLSPELALDFPSTVWSNIIPNEYLANFTEIAYQAIGLRPGGDSNQDFARTMNPKGVPTVYNKYLGTGNHRYSLDVVIPITKFKDDFYPYLVFETIDSSTKLKNNDIDAARVMITPPSVTDLGFNSRALSKIVANGSVGLEHLEPNLRQLIKEAK
jgi:hypothetical protein